MLHVFLYDSNGAFARKGWNMATVSFAVFMSLSQSILWNSAIGIIFLYNTSSNFNFV